MPAGDPSGRRFAPATARNREPILQVLRRHMPASGLVLEVASGTGEHAAYFARHLGSDLAFQPSDHSPEALTSIEAWVREAGLANLRMPIALDVCQSPWPIAEASCVLCINMIHIAPWEAAIALIKGAAGILPPRGPLILYGPFRRGGAHTASSNDAFDRDLRARNPMWGVRDLEDVAALAAASGFSQPIVETMPANNLTVIFTRLP